MSKQHRSQTALELTDRGERLATEQRRFSAALRQLTRALKLDPQNARAHRLRGLVYRERQQFGRAKRDLIAAVNLEPNSSANHLFLGVYLVDRQAYLWGIAHLEQALALESERYVGTKSCANLVQLYAYQHLGDDVAAREICSALIADEPREPCYRCLYEWLTLRIGCQEALRTDSGTRQILAAPRFSTRCGEWPGLLCRFEAWRVLSIYVLSGSSDCIESGNED